MTREKSTCQPEVISIFFAPFCNDVWFFFLQVNSATSFLNKNRSGEKLSSQSNEKQRAQLATAEECTGERRWPEHASMPSLGQHCQEVMSVLILDETEKGRKRKTSWPQEQQRGSVVSSGMAVGCSLPSTSLARQANACCMQHPCSGEVSRTHKIVFVPTQRPSAASRSFLIPMAVR